VTDLGLLDGQGTTAAADQLVAIYPAAMAAPPFFETELETGWFAARSAFASWAAAPSAGTTPSGWC
jgi:hypothetical protein